jgi:hypothetical protein
VRHRWLAGHIEGRVCKVDAIVGSVQRMWVSWVQSMRMGELDSGVPVRSKPHTDGSGPCELAACMQGWTAAQMGTATEQQ